MKKKNAFTLIEVLLALGITAILFLGVTQVLITSMKYAKGAIGVIRFQQEQQRLRLAVINAFAESEIVVYPTPSAAPVADKIILRNKPTSGLLPFTIIEPTNDNRLVIRDFTLNPATGSTPATTRNDKTIGSYVLRVATNRITIGDGTNGSCGGTVTTDCVVFGYHDNTLAFGTTAHAPFISAPLISDIRIDANADYIDILSPYEKREYKIRVATNNTPPTTAPPWSVQASTISGQNFPSYYAGTTPTTPTLNATTTFIPPTPPSRPYNVTNLTYNATNPTGAPPSSPVELRVIRFDVTDTANPNLTATVTVPVMVRR